MFLTPLLGYFGVGLKLRARPDQDRMRCFDTKRTVASIGAAQSMARPKENGPSRFEGRAIVARGGYENEISIRGRKSSARYGERGDECALRYAWKSANSVWFWFF